MLVETNTITAPGIYDSPVETFTIVCPECKTRTVTVERPDAPQNKYNGIYCLFCDRCRYEVYPNLIRDTKGKKRDA